MGLYNAPRPNTFGEICFKSYWDIVKSDLVASIQFFFLSGKLPEKFNSVHVVFILKQSMLIEWSSSGLLHWLISSSR